jgi:hypothetical protein
MFFTRNGQSVIIYNCVWYLALRLAEYRRFCDVKRHYSASTEGDMSFHRINCNNSWKFSFSVEFR